MPETERAYGVQGPLPRMAEGGMPQIMAHSDRLRQILVEPQRPGDGPGNLGNLKRVGQAGTVMVPLRRQENLGLVL